MKLKEKISWLMGRVQRSLFPHLNECLDTRLTELEQRLVTILEVVQVEKYVPKRAATSGGAVSLLIGKPLPELLSQRQCVEFPQPVTYDGHFWLP
ncbi:MAG: hypothetical protein Q7U88_06035 [Desulfocapsaceae bacterium]|nr:hypothetical protein [Desulfocapsaceae bacterium]